MKIGKAGRGTQIHIVEEFIRDDKSVITYISCGAQQFNGSGNGRLSRVYNFDLSKVTCKRCLKKLANKKAA